MIVKEEDMQVIQRARQSVSGPCLGFETNPKKDLQVFFKKDGFKEAFNLGEVFKL